MKQRLLSLLVSIFFLGNIFAQTDTTIWKVVKKVEENNYIISIPNDWKEVPISENSGMQHKFDLTGIGIVGTVLSAPMNANFSISRRDGVDEKVALAQVIDDFSGFYDRLTEAGYNFDTTQFIIKSGETATYLHTRFYRRSKVSNYSKYYLIVPYPKLNTTFILTFHFQYKDAMYDIERTGRFKAYAETLFKNFVLR